MGKKKLENKVQRAIEALGLVIEMLGKVEKP